MKTVLLLSLVLITVSGCSNQPLGGLFDYCTTNPMICAYKDKEDV